jgi:hypothetical protein
MENVKGALQGDILLTSLAKGTHRPGLRIWEPLHTAGSEIFIFFNAGNEKIYILLPGAPFWRPGGPPLAVSVPPFRADSRRALDLKVQKVHR